MVPRSIWPYSEVGHTQDAKREIQLLFPTEMTPILGLLRPKCGRGFSIRRKNYPYQPLLQRSGPQDLKADPEAGATVVSARTDTRSCLPGSPPTGRPFLRTSAALPTEGPSTPENRRRCRTGTPERSYPPGQSAEQGQVPPGNGRGRKRRARG